MNNLIGFIVGFIVAGLFLWVVAQFCNRLIKKENKKLEEEIKTDKKEDCCDLNEK